MMEETHSDIIHLRLLHSDEFLRAAHHLTTTSSLASVVSFLYYASFHAVIGLLKQSGVSVKSHLSAMKLFNTQYVKAGLISDNYGKFYTLLYRERDKSDHHDFAVFTADDVLPLVP
jgi:uncharacterized protein (UPF0332 family)